MHILTEENFKKVPNGHNQQPPKPPTIPKLPAEKRNPSQPENPPIPPKDKTITIKVNTVEKELDKNVKKLSYEEVIVLAYGNYNEDDRVIYTVNYSNGPKQNPKGTLVKGKNVKVGEGMIFNVSRSDKS